MTRNQVCALLFALGITGFTGTALGTPPSRTERIDQAVQRARAWIRSLDLQPFAAGLPEFRNYVLFVEASHRAWLVEKDPSRKEAMEEEIRPLLLASLDETKLRALLGESDANKAYSDFAVLADRCAAHGIDPDPLRRAMQSRREEVLREVERVPASLKALYAAYLPALGIVPPESVEQLRAEGMMAKRPREADLTLADVYYLTHEIFASTDYAARPLTGASAQERSWLLRVLPFYTLFYANLANLDILAELLTCLHAAEMTETWAYQEGIRVMVENQNTDGSFGTQDPRRLGRPVRPEDSLHPTMNCLWALLLDGS